MAESPRLTTVGAPEPGPSARAGIGNTRPAAIRVRAGRVLETRMRDSFTRPWTGYL
jgi:hypothetical protein